MSLEQKMEAFRKAVPVVYLDERKILDPTAPDASTRIVNGESSNALDWNNVRLPWVYPMYKTLLANFWTPFEINLTHDIKDFANLELHEKEAFLSIYSLLRALDSMQTDYIMRTTDYYTDSSIVALLAIVDQQEVVHNQSYDTIKAAVATLAEQEFSNNVWKTMPTLLERNEFISKGYDRAIKEATLDMLIQSLIYDVVLEGIFFYAGFAFFYDLMRNGKMVAAGTMINYINRDEQQHVRIFTEIYKQILIDFPEFDVPELKELGTEILREAANLEIAWANEIIGDKFATIDSEELAGYVRFMANVRAKQLQLPTPFERQETNPMSWIKVYEDTDMGKTDFFEQKVRNYKKASEGFNDVDSLNEGDLL